MHGARPKEMKKEAAKKGAKKRAWNLSAARKPSACLLVRDVAFAHPLRLEWVITVAPARCRSRTRRHHLRHRPTQIRRHLLTARVSRAHRSSDRDVCPRRRRLVGAGVHTGHTGCQRRVLARAYLHTSKRRSNTASHARKHDSAVSDTDPVCTVGCPRQIDIRPSEHLVSCSFVPKKSSPL